MYLGIDVGTTATKAILIDSAQRALATASVTYDVDHAVSGVSENDPQIWVDAVRAAIARLRVAVPKELAQTTALGLSGQMHSFVVLDKQERPIRPAMLWNDARGEEEASALRTWVSRIEYVTGVVPMASFTAAKLLWLRRMRSEEFSRIRHILWAKDFIRHWLTGEFATDMSDAAGAQLLDQRGRRWAGAVTDYIGVRSDWLPKLLEGTDSSGNLRRQRAEELGLPTGIVVAAGGGDAAAGALGLGCVNDGEAFISLGTGAVFVASQGEYRPRTEAQLHNFAHCVPARWYRMAAMLNGASCLSWVARLCNEESIESLLHRVEERSETPGRILFLPYLRGERTPHNDLAARGAFVGLDAACDSVDLTRAVLEGVAFSLRIGQELLTDGGETLTFVGMTGGGSRSAYWNKLIASILKRQLTVIPNADFVAALGGARLAMVASGRTSLIEAGYPPPTAKIVDPISALSVAYEDRFQMFREMYVALRPFTDSLHRVRGSEVIPT